MGFCSCLSEPSCCCCKDFRADRSDIMHIEQGVREQSCIPNEPADAIACSAGALCKPLVFWRVFEAPLRQ